MTSPEYAEGACSAKLRMKKPGPGMEPSDWKWSRSFTCCPSDPFRSTFAFDQAPGPVEGRFVSVPKDRAVQSEYAGGCAYSSRRGSPVPMDPVYVKFAQAPDARRKSNGTYAGFTLARTGSMAVPVDASVLLSY